MRAILNTKQRNAKRVLIEQISALPKTDDITIYAPLVIEMFKKVPAVVWQSIDDDIGNAAFPFRGDHRGYLVRRVRNHPDFGRQLFAVLGR